MFLSELFREFFTMKTCIYLPHNETFEENCVVWEKKYFFRKEMYSNQGKFSLETASTDENTVLKEIVDKRSDYEQRRAKEELRPIVKQKKYEYRKGSAGNKAMKSSKLGENNRSTAQENIRNLRISGQSKMMPRIAERKNAKNVSKKNTDRNDLKKNNNGFLNVDHANVSRRIAGNENNSGSKNLKSRMKLNDGTKNLNGSRRKDGGDIVSADDNRKTTNKISLAGGQLLRSERMVAGNKPGNKDAVDVQICDKSDGPKSNLSGLHELSNDKHSEATSKIKRAAGLQPRDTSKSEKSGTTFDGSKPLLHLSSKADGHGMDQSSFPSTCNKTNLVYDDRRKTLKNSSYQDESSISYLDNEWNSRSGRTDTGFFVLKITAGRQN